MSYSASSMSAPETDDIGGDGEILYESNNKTICEASGSLVCGSVEILPDIVEGERSPLTDLEPVDSERRTFEWITQLSVPSSSVGDVADVLSLTSDQTSTRY
ncbi:hypothetical protein ILYODFUR_030081 [Ilyodon furcidens]|uniref:Uncharacterized protein n=1 Tax=Ilyodon furcidens TaxID=33524 RepID=A0ABV0SQD0_9TELE